MTAQLGSSPIGLGVWPDAGEAVSRRGDRDRLERLLWHAAALGVEWVDTAHAYDGGTGEVELGRCLGSMPEEVRPAVMTKGGIVEDKGLARRRLAVLHPSVLRTQLEGSLRRLRLEAVDTYLLHFPDDSGVPVEESWAAVAALAEEGKARRIGLSSFGLDQLRRCEAVRHVDVYLTRLTPLDIAARAPVLEWCAGHATAVIAWAPGDAQRLFDPSYPGALACTPHEGLRARLDRITGSSLPVELMALAALRDVARRRGLRLEQAAAAWMLEQEGVAALAVGATRGAQLDRWVAGPRVSLSPGDVRRITAAGAGGVLRSPVRSLPVNHPA